MELVFITNSVYNSRTYIIVSENKRSCWLVDCGDVEKVIEQVPEGCEIKGVFLTHVHYDHIYGLPKLVSLFPYARICTNEIGKIALADEKINMSRYHEDPINFDSKNIKVCEDCSEVELFEGIMAVVHYTPGHNASCLTYEIGEYLFTGDSYIPGLKVVTNLPGGNKEQAIESLEEIQKLSAGKTICPGH